MTGAEGPALSLGFKLAVAAGRRFFATSEFQRLCAALAETFGDRIPLGAADYEQWGKDDAFAAALGQYTQPPHKFDRAALVRAITPLVGQVDADTSPEEFAGEVADAISVEMRRAKQGDALVRLESDRIIEAVHAGAQPEAPDDPTWAGSRLEDSVRRLGETDPVGARALRAALDVPNRAAAIKGVVADAPGWLREAGADVWFTLGRFCEVEGLWTQAQVVYTEAAERPGCDRPRAWMAAAAAAGNAGDPDAQERLRERALALDPDHFFVRLVQVVEERDPARRLEGLDALPETTEVEWAGVAAAVRATTLLDLEDVDGARSAAGEAEALAPRGLQVREAALAVKFAENRERRMAGKPTRRRELLELAEGYRRLRDDLRQSCRLEESGGMLQRIAECQTLADRPDLALATLEEALPGELAEGEVALHLAEAALNAGAPDLAERFVETYGGDSPPAELLNAHLQLRDPARRTEAVATLDRRIDSGDFDAAVLRLIAAVPSTDDVAWSEPAEQLVRSVSPVFASSLRSEWLERRGRHEEARRELAKHTDDPRALGELMVKFAQDEEWGRAGAAARALQQKEIGPDEKVTIARVLRHCGDEAQAETLLRDVVGDEEAHDEEVIAAFRVLAGMLVAGNRFPEVLDLVATVRPRYPDAAWAAAYALAKMGRLPEARSAFEGLDPPGVDEAALAVDLIYLRDPPDSALARILAIADTLEEQNEHIELRATFALLRTPDDGVTPELVERAGPASFVERFPDSRALWKEEAGSDEAAVELIREHARARAEVVGAAEAHVLQAGDRPVGTLAYAVGSTLAEVWSQLPALPLGYDGEGLDDEVAAAERALGGPVVVEMGTLGVLGVLGDEIARGLAAEFPLSVVGTATVHDLIRAGIPTLSGSEDVLHQVRWNPETDTVEVLEVSVEEQARSRQAVEEMQVLASRLQPAPAVNLEESDDDGASPVAGVYEEVTAVARHTGYAVLTDDRCLRRMLTAQGTPTFGTLAVLVALSRKGFLGEGVLEKARRLLHERGALGLASLDEMLE